MKFLDKLAWYLPLSGKTSQAYEGEDILLWRLFTEEIPIRNGFYIDVGAFHPRQYSNTWLLRKKLGFRGINIEPSKKGYRQFKIWRPRDINIRCLCGCYTGYSLYWYNKDEPALSKIDGAGEILEIITLDQICYNHNIKEIDLLNIDVEGGERNVLKGHNWDIKPKVIICELNTIFPENYIKRKGYKLYAKTKRNGIYVA